MKSWQHLIVCWSLSLFTLSGCSGELEVASKQHTYVDTITPSNQHSRRIVAQQKERIKNDLKEKGLTLYAPIFIRIFKEESELELWVKKDDRKFALFKSWPICKWAGELGPKLREGDRQSPEGFYYVTPSRMNPNSSYHLSMDIGYPNQYDRYHERTGSDIMIHGICGSLGCYAMTNPVIEEIWVLSESALGSGQPFFRVHVFPFRMNEKNMERHKDSKWIEFWENLKEGYDFFENKKYPPDVSVKESLYTFN